jgi:uncharacterized protein (TIGR03067 family)
MRLRFALVLTAVLAAMSWLQAGSQPAAPAESSSLVGSWTMAEATVDDKPLPEAGRPDVRWVFTMTTLTSFVGGEPRGPSEPYQLPPDVKGGLDIGESKADNGRVLGPRQRVLYELAGDTLRVCYFQGGTSDRPRSFSDRPSGSGSTAVLVFRRTRP